MTSPTRSDPPTGDPQPGHPQPDDPQPGQPPGNPQSWVGSPVLGHRGELLGHVGALWLDNSTGRPTWVGVRGREHTAVVPIEPSRFDGTTLHLPYEAARLRSAPLHDPSVQLSHEDGEALYRHYALDPEPRREAPGKAPERDRPGDAGMVRSEEQMRIGHRYVRVGRARLVTTIVTEDVTFTVPVRREEVRVVYDTLPLREQTATDIAPSPAVVEVVRHEEQVRFVTEIVPVERVRMVREVVTADQLVSAEVRVERVEVDTDDAAR